MSQNENVYKFIDKDKLIQYLTTPKMWDNEPDCVWTPLVYQLLKDKVEAGFFSFQVGGE